jgi:hypothetical protein
MRPAQPHECGGLRVHCWRYARACVCASRGGRGVTAHGDRLRSNPKVAQTLVTAVLWRFSEDTMLAFAHGASTGYQMW